MIQRKVAGECFICLQHHISPTSHNLIGGNTVKQTRVRLLGHVHLIYLKCMFDAVIDYKL